MAKRSERIFVLGESELDVIVKKVNEPADRKSFSEVCKLWYTVESRNRSSIRLLSPHFPRKVFSRFPNLVTFETSYFVSDDDLEFLGQTCLKLEVINLNYRGSTGHKPSAPLGVGLLSLAKSCLKLSKVMLSKRSINDSVAISLISSAPNLTHLDLGYCYDVSDEALDAIGSSSSIRYLNLEHNLKTTDRGLSFLGNGSISKTLKESHLNYISDITDVGVSQLRKTHCLVHLSLACWSRSHARITDVGGVAISAISKLKTLSLRGQHKVSERTFVALAQNCPNIEQLICHSVSVLFLSRC